MTDNEIVAISRNANLTAERMEKLHKIYLELEEIGYAGLSGSFKITQNEKEAKFLLSIEEQLLQEEQQKIINSPFVR